MEPIYNLPDRLLRGSSSLFNLEKSKHYLERSDSLGLSPDVFRASKSVANASGLLRVSNS